MPEPRVRKASKPGSEPLSALAVVFFLVAVAMAAAPAVHAGPATLAGLLLLIGLAGVTILGTSPDSIDLAEDRKRFGTLLKELGIPQPDNGMAASVEEA